MTHTTTRGHGRLAEIDALRGLAALAVVLFHYTARYDALFGHTSAPLLSVPWGHLGVNLFFIVSGFVIFMTLERTRRPRDFLVSRFSRLYPAYWVAIVLTFGITRLAGLAQEQVPFTAALVNLSMLQGFLHVPSVDGVYWTLEIELIFYAWMLLLFCTRMLGRVHLFVAALLALRLVYFESRTVLGVELPWTIGHLLLLDFIAWFGAGIMVYRRTAGSPTPRADLAVIGAAIASLVIVDGVGVAALLAILAATVYGATRGVLPILGHRSLVALGCISYSLYLLHENIGWAVIRRAEAAGIDSNAAIALALLLSVALAILVTRCVERPALAWIRARYGGARAADEPRHHTVTENA